MAAISRKKSPMTGWKTDSAAKLKQTFQPQNRWPTNRASVFSFGIIKMVSGTGRKVPDTIFTPFQNRLFQRAPDVIFQKSWLNKLFKYLLIDQFIQIALNDVWPVKSRNKNFHVASFASAFADNNPQTKLHARAPPIFLRNVGKARHILFAGRLWDLFHAAKAPHYTDKEEYQNR